MIIFTFVSISSKMMALCSETRLVYFKELSMYILAGRKKLQQVREHDLAAAEAKEMCIRDRYWMLQR